MKLGAWTYRCECGGEDAVHGEGDLELVHDWDDLDAERLRRTFRERLGERHTIHASGVWRYRELIAPELPDEAIVTRGEGNTRLYASEAAAAYAGVRSVWLKAQSGNPSGSFKDNGMTAAVSFGRYLGCTRFACTSTGNTSSSLAMYASAAGGRAIVLMPERHVADGKLLQTLAYGADIVKFPGTYDDGIRYLETHAIALGLYVCNSLNPLRIEGQKSIVYELAQDLDWRMPDWIVLPGGALSNTAALGMGLRDLRKLGLIDRLPRVAVIQAEGAAPFHRMVAGGAETLAPESSPRTRATALHIGHPPGWRRALRTLRLTDGVTAAVPDRAILEAKAVIDRSGVGCEPASAASLAGLKALRESGVIHRDETAACLLTGHILKDTDSIREYHIDGLWGGAHRNRPSSAEGGELASALASLVGAHGNA